MQTIYKLAIFSFFILTCAPYTVHAATKAVVPNFTPEEIEEYNRRDESFAERRAKALQKRKSLTPQMRKAYDANIFSLISQQQELFGEQGPRTADDIEKFKASIENILKAGANPNTKNTDDFSALTRIISSDLPIEFCLPFLNHSADTNYTAAQSVVGDECSSPAKLFHLGTLKNNNKDTWRQISLTGISETYLSLEKTHTKNKHTSMEDFLYGRINGYKSTVKDVLPVVALVCLVDQYLQPVPFKDFIQQQADIRTQHRHTFAEIDEEKTELKKKFQKTKKSAPIAAAVKQKKRKYLNKET